MATRSPASELCTWKMCRSDLALLHIIDQARHLAKQLCESSFQYELWNCNTSALQPFRNVYRETAFLHALYSASLAYSYYHSCSQAQVDSLYSYSCGDLKDGIKFARQLLRKYHTRRDPVNRVNRHNCEFGLKILQQQFQEHCKCHGISGSCSVKTCYHLPLPFRITVEALKKQYHNARALEFSNTASSDKRKLSPHLYYLDPSPLFCDSSPGRRCLDDANCVTICCTRGYHVRNVSVKVHCGCYWEQSVLLRCNTCNIDKQKFNCF